MKYRSVILKWKDIFKRLAGSGIFPHELAFLLDSPVRKLILSPKKLAERLHLSPSSKVLEIGSGPGYFSIEIARRIADGYIILSDIQVEMLQKSRIKMFRENVKNAYTVNGDATNLPFGNSAFDLVFLVTVLG